MSFTCITCHVAFKEADVQREHYKTDWHRYNLKRKVAELLPVTAEAFQQRVLAHRAQAAELEVANTSTHYCEACRKKFTTIKSYENHISSKKHQENLLKPRRQTSSVPKKEPEPIIDGELDDSDAMEEVDSDEWEDTEGEAIPVDECLFCPYKSQDMEANLKHMTLAHSFFIPDSEYVTDSEGLLGYLGEKVGRGHTCLWCGHYGKQFYSVEATQKHMVDKGHTKIYHEAATLLEYEDFYDYSASYPEGEQSHATEEIDLDKLEDTGYELTLPSGAVIGHRSLSRYYKQKLDPNPRPVPRALPSALYQFKALGWTTSSKETVERKARDIKFMRNVISKHQMQLGIKANKLQHHFRRQVDC
nr:EOG090X06E3 [Lepidurus arcticus]